MNLAQNGVDIPWSKRRDGYKLSKRRAMGDDEGDDDHQQLYTYGMYWQAFKNDAASSDPS